MTWIASNHSPSILDFVVLLLVGLLFTFGFSTVNWIEGGVVVFILGVCLGVAEPVIEKSKMTSFVDSLYMPILVSFIVSRVLYRFEHSRWRLNLPEEVAINVDDQGFEIIGQMMAANNTRYKSVTWSKVCRINAFKRDLFSYDLICLEFYQENIETPVEVNEEIDGFKFLTDILPTKFKGFDEEWYSKVHKPAFATNFTEVWKRV